MTASTSLMTSGRVSLIVAIRSATSAWSRASSMARTCGGRAPCADWPARARSSGATRRAGRRAICSGGVRRRNSNGRSSIVAARRPMISSARSGADRALQHVARVVDAALGDVLLGQHVLDGLLDDGLRRSSAGPSAPWPSRATAPRSRSRARWPKTSAACSAPSDTSRTAAFWMPLSLARGARAGRPGQSSDGHRG